MGPLEYLVLRFEGNRFTGEIVPELQRLRERQVLRVVDLLLLTKDGEGKLTERELTDLNQEEAAAFGPIKGDVRELLTETDIEELASGLENNSSGAIVLFEHLWATRLREVILKANGVVVNEGWIAPSALAELNAELAAAQVVPSPDQVVH